MTADIYNQVLTSQKENLNEDLNGALSILGSDLCMSVDENRK